MQSHGTSLGGIPLVLPAAPVATAAFLLPHPDFRNLVVCQTDRLHEVDNYPSTLLPLASSREVRVVQQKFTTMTGVQSHV